MTIATLIVAALLQAAPAAQVRNVTGEVDLIRSAETTAVHAGDIILAGDRVHTLKGSSLALTTESGVIVVLNSETSLEMKNVSGQPVPFLVEGRVNVTSTGKPARIETRYGQIVGLEDFQDFDVSYSGDVVQVLLIGGAVKAEVSDSSKVVFKNAYDPGSRVYEAGSISPTTPRESNGLSIFVYPEVSNPTRRRTVPVTRPIPAK